jgi:hypothetical protein
MGLNDQGIFMKLTNIWITSELILRVLFRYANQAIAWILKKPWKSAKIDI